MKKHFKSKLHRKKGRKFNYIQKTFLPLANAITFFVLALGVAVTDQNTIQKCDSCPVSLKFEIEVLSNKF